MKKNLKLKYTVFWVVIFAWAAFLNMAVTMGLQAAGMRPIDALLTSGIVVALISCMLFMNVFGLVKKKEVVEYG